MVPCRPFSVKLGMVAAVGAMLLAALTAHAQNSSSEEIIIQAAAADRSAASAATTRYRHVLLANTAAARTPGAQRIAERSQSYESTDAGGPGGNGKVLQYPGDFGNEGGQVVTTAVSHVIYLQRLPDANCTMATCWGDPEQFLRDLGRSEFIHVVDQYVGASGNQRYTVGFHATVNYTAPTGPLLDSDIAAFVHAVAVQTGASGYGHIYHVFLPPGQDECAVPGYCYSPDNPATFFFCAYHDSTDFPDIGHVLFTVHPYTNVPGCQVQPGTPRGTLVDSVNTAVGHELIETITDPDGITWRNDSGAFDLGNYEIADECLFYVVVGNQAFNNVPTFFIGAHLYSMQLVYSNEQHGCSSAPSRERP
jgi:hypothetical protein